ncbi:MAG: 2OG-Fe(II) oxygenase [Parvularculaceae bacterium]
MAARDFRLIENDFATDDAKWAACLARDESAEGAFWSCVATTGVYCRPSCAGRPLRKNVTFVAARAEAERAGYRPCKRCRPERFVAGPLHRRIADIDWPRAEAALEEQGWAHLGALLDEAECRDLIARYDADARYRSRVNMARHGFGAGEYRYFADPLLSPVKELREGLYPRLVPTAEKWANAFGGPRRYPTDHKSYRRECAAVGQSRPTPLILKYGPGDYNRLHQDLYGGEVFPIQVAVLLSEPGRDFDGGAFILAEQRPRMQTRAEVVLLKRGDAVAFAVNDRPVRGARGLYRAKMRHGVSTITKGARLTLGVIFHDAA